MTTVQVKQEYIIIYADGQQTPVTAVTLYDHGQIVKVECVKERMTDETPNV